MIWGIVLFVAGAVALLDSWMGFGPAMKQYSGYLYAFVFMGGSLGILAHLHRKNWEERKKVNSQGKVKKEEKEAPVV